MSESHPTGSTHYRLFTASYVALLTGQIVSILGDRLNNIALVELIAEETGRFSEAGSTLEMSKLFLAVTLLVLAAWVVRVRRARRIVREWDKQENGVAKLDRDRPDSTWHCSRAAVTSVCDSI